MPIIQTFSTPFAIGTAVQLGTNGSVLFIDGSTDVGQDNSNFRFDNTGKILTLISGVQADSSGIYPTTTNTKNLGLFQNKFANLWVTTISGATLQSATANTPSIGSNNTQLATTAFVASYVAASGTGGGGDVYLANNQTFTGVNTFSDLRFGTTDRYNIGTHSVRPSGLFVGASGIHSTGKIITNNGLYSEHINVYGNPITGTGIGSMLVLNQMLNTSGAASLFLINVAASGSNLNTKAIEVKTDGTSRFSISPYGDFTCANNIGDTVSYNFSGITANTSAGFVVKEALGPYLYIGATDHIALQINDVSHIQMDNAAMHPSTNNTMTLGTPAEVFHNGYFTGLNLGASGLHSIGNITASGTITGFANLTGNSTAVTQPLGTDNTTIATTAFVRTYVGASGTVAGSGGGGGDVYLANSQIFTGVNTFRDIRFSDTTFYIGTTATRPSGIFVGLSGINSTGPMIFPTPSGAASNTLGATTDFVKSAISGARTGSIGFAFPSGTLIAGMQSLPIMCPTGRTIRGITLLGEGSGSVSIDIWRVGYGSYPMGSANTIFTGTNRATIVSGVKSRDTTLSTLISPVINRFDTVKAVVTSVSVSGIYAVTGIMDTFVE